MEEPNLLVLRSGDIIKGRFHVGEDNDIIHVIILDTQSQTDCTKALGLPESFHTIYIGGWYTYPFHKDDCLLIKAERRPINGRITREPRSNP